MGRWIFLHDSGHFSAGLFDWLYAGRCWADCGGQHAVYFCVQRDQEASTTDAVLGIFHSSICRRALDDILQ